MLFRDFRWGHFARHGGLLLAGGFVAGGVFIWSGFYNVAASSQHWMITTWILEQVRRNSVATQTYFVPDPPPLDDPEMIRLGAAHYEGGCSPCHARPGEPINAIVEGMLPPPPDLALALTDEDVKTIFWTVKNGFKYTAMPAWPAQRREDEVWALTAFVRKLPGMSVAEYEELAGVPPGTRDGAARLEELARGAEPVALAQCVRCHGDATVAPHSALVPTLHGQSEAFMLRALIEYAEGSRESGIMQPVADLLSEAEMRSMASYYAGLPPLSRGLPPPDAARVARGREIAEAGDATAQVPACETCHGAGRSRSFPALAGQPEAYLVALLRAYQNGAGDRTEHGRIMAPIARRMTPEQILDAAAFYAARPPESGATERISLGDAVP